MKKLEKIRNNYHKLQEILNEFINSNRFNLKEFSKIRIIKDELMSLKFKVDING